MSEISMRFSDIALSDCNLSEKPLFFSDKEVAMSTVSDIGARIKEAAPKGVWTASDFLDLGTREAVDKGLQRLQGDGSIRRPARGIYDLPQRNSLTGGLTFPSRSAYVDAIARRDKLRLVVDGMTAANDIGLTTAVPARSSVFSDATPRTIEIVADPGSARDGKPTVYKLDFKHASARKLFWAGRPAMRIVQAIGWLSVAGDDDHDELAHRVAQALERAPNKQAIVDDLTENIGALPTWMHRVVRSIERVYLDLNGEGKSDKSLILTGPRP